MTPQEQTALELLHTDVNPLIIAEYLGVSLVDLQRLIKDSQS